MAKMGSSIVLSVIFMISSLVMIHPGDVSSENTRSHGSIYIIEDSSIIRMGNDAVEIVLNKTTGGGLEDIIDHSTGTGFFGDSEVPAFLYLLYFFNGSAVEGALQWDGYSIDYSNETTTGGSFVNITYRNIKGYDLNASVSIRLDEYSNMFRMRLGVVNDEDFVLRSVYFPFAAGLTEIGENGSDDEMFYPGGDGAVFKNPFFDLQNFSFSGMYPSDLSMQVMSYYDPDIAGIYVSSHDTSGRPKEIGFGPMEWGGTPHLSVSYNHLIPEYPGNDFEMKYDLNMGVFHGDWMDTAEIYREWIETTPFVSGGKIGVDKEIPEWFLNTSIVQVVRSNDPDIVERPYSEIVEVADEHARVTGASTTALIMGWGGNGAWVGPNYFPPAGGNDSFTENVSLLNKNGDHSFVYISGTVWRVTRDDIGYSNHSYFNREGLPWVALDRNGQPIFDYIYETLGWHSARMDPMTSFWQDMVVYNAIECVKLGVDAVQIDEFPIGSIYPCYNESHGHPPGYSEEIARAYIAILSRIRSEGRAINPDLILSMEEPCELYVPYMDTYVSRDDAPEFLLYPAIVNKFTDRVEFVPFFTWVFHEYITAFGEHLPMDKGYSAGFSDQCARAIARTLVTGEIINMAGEKEDHRSQELFELYNRSAAASTGYANRYLIGGSPERPLDLDIPIVKVNWYDHSAGTGGPPISEPVIMHSTWKRGNDTGIVLVNWGADSWESEIEVPPRLIPYDDASVRVKINGIVTDIIERVDDRTNISISLNKNDVALIEILRLPDLEITDVTLPESEILTNDTFDCRVTVLNSGTKASPATVEACLDNEIMRFGSSTYDLQSGNEVDIWLPIDTRGRIGRYNLSISVDPRSDFEELFEDNNIWQMELEIMERPRSDLTLTVIDDETGDPVWGASVDIIGGYPYNNFSKTGIDTNKFSFPSIPGGEYRISVDTPSYQPYHSEITIPEGADINRTIMLEWNPESHSLLGTVHDNETGRTVPSLEIEIYFPGSDRPILAVSDVNGSFSANTSGPGPFRLEIRDPRFKPFAEMIQINRSRTAMILDIRLYPNHFFDITVLVTDSERGQPIANASVELVGVELIFRTGSDGSVVFQDIMEGEYRLFVAAEGYFANNISINLDVDREFTISLDPVSDNADTGPGIICGTVTDIYGNQLSNVSVLDQNGTVLVITNESGSFRLEFTEEGDYALIFNKTGYFEKQRGPFHVARGDCLNISVALDMIPDPEPVRDDKGEDAKSPFLFLMIVTAVIVLIGAFVFFLMRGRNLMDEE